MKMTELIKQAQTEWDNGSLDRLNFELGQIKASIKGVKEKLSCQYFGVVYLDVPMTDDEIETANICEMELAHLEQEKQMLKIRITEKQNQARFESKYAGYDYKCEGL